MKSAHKIIEDHYGLGRPVTDEEVRSEIENLLRKEKKGNLDDSQERLMSTLRVAGAMPERDQTQDKATARPWINKGETLFPDGTKAVSVISGGLLPHFVFHAEGENREANAALIVQSVNEHAALVAVAEAAKRVSEAWSTANDDAMTVLIGRLNKAIHESAAVRKS